ncbi:hypothetical protein M113_0758 [Bacteroides fragilis str. 3986 N3]|nr:hypothetical protein M111_0564 [Bacteroides fragilis str. 3986T(B)10]EYA54087.1 hypothetical protein M114_0770 [Bacteroides fragilis str. 3986 N(B)22]EYA58270.1 hypothetical protein M112_0765 [Bacteroides fragilis str. 3986 T(B)13]EYE70163.1 hypothetical protein M113_0758 [Bacteroides fragilis str. 3986 N3]
MFVYSPSNTYLMKIVGGFKKIIKIRMRNRYVRYLYVYYG